MPPNTVVQDRIVICHLLFSDNTIALIKIRQHHSEQSALNAFFDRFCETSISRLIHPF